MGLSNTDLHIILDAVIFATGKHHGQVRKDQQHSPYITHPLTVAQVILNIGDVSDLTILTAAILHDTIEDTCTNNSEIQDRFGNQVLNLVLEVTDDKSLPKMERKRLQVVHAPHLSIPARILKLGDKLVNCRDIILSPPEDWDLNRRQEYLQWSADVVYYLRGANHDLENAFHALLSEAEHTLGFKLQPITTIQNRPWAP